MHIVITTPTLGMPHGGTRILNEWANRLSTYHKVTMYVQDKKYKCNWFNFNPSIQFTYRNTLINRCDILIIGSPHSIELQRRINKNAKCFIFLQMLEHLFNPSNIQFNKLCEQTYKTKHPILSISKWNIDYISNITNNSANLHYIGNGTNFNDFPIEINSNKEDVVLIEGWNPNNATKDIDYIGPKVACKLKRLGYKIIAYSQRPAIKYADIPDEYYVQPTLLQMNELYSRSKILIKASKYDARSLSPLEAMTKGTPTARAIIEGDDDLINDYNCLRTPYNENELYRAALDMLQNTKLYNTLSNNCIKYIQEYSWDYWIPRILKCLEN